MILIFSNFRSKERNHKANSEFAFIFLNFQMQKKEKKLKQIIWKIFVTDKVFFLIRVQKR